METEEAMAKRRKLSDEEEEGKNPPSENNRSEHEDGDDEETGKEDDEAENENGDGQSDGVSVDQLRRDALKMLLEPLTKEQLMSLLLDAGLQYSALADDIRDMASKDPAHRKLFVRGLAWETSSQTLRDAFEPYGEIEEGAVIVDKSTGKSRGFGFITYKHMDSAQRALKEPNKTIDGRITICNLAAAGPVNSTGAIDAHKKLYIGGLSYDTTTETIIKIFSMYGEIEEGAVAYDKKSNVSRGFAFVTYKSADAAGRALEDSANKTIEGRKVFIKLADQKDKAGNVLVAQPTPLQASFPMNPGLAGYPRPQVQAGAGSSIGFPGYSSGVATGYPGPSVYAGLHGTHYASAYGGGYAAGQAVQPGVHASALGGNFMLPPLYYGPNP